MAWQGLKLNLKVAQKQILTPGLVQMVSVLALNRLELKEMINTEMVANPVLEELSEEATTTDNYSDENFLKAETEKVPEKPETNVFDEFDVGTFFNQYLDTGGDGGQSQEREISERPSFEKFLSSPTGLTEHLTSAHSRYLILIMRLWRRSSEPGCRSISTKDGQNSIFPLAPGSIRVPSGGNDRRNARQIWIAIYIKNDRKHDHSAGTIRDRTAKIAIT